MKERVFKYEIGILFVFLLLSLLLISAVFLWDTKYPPDYLTVKQNIQPPAATTAGLGELATRVENLENNQAYNLKIFEWKLDQKLLIFGWVALFISFAAGFLGLKTYNDLEKVIRERVNSSLEKALYQLDPTNLPIHIYQGATRRNTEGKVLRTNARDDLEKVAERLRLTGLQNSGLIEYLDKTSLSGITVIPIDDEDDEDDFKKFVEKYKFHLDKERSGFILYTPPGYQIKKAQNYFENTAIANMPVTVASAVLVVGRGLKNRAEV